MATDRARRDAMVTRAMGAFFLLGSACFLACALTACGLGITLKAPRLRRLRSLAHEVVEHEVREVRAYVGP